MTCLLRDHPGKKSPFRVRMPGAPPLRPQLRFSFRIPLPLSPEPPEAFTGLVKIGIAIPRELLKGRGSRGGDGPRGNSAFRVSTEGAFTCRNPS